MEIIGRKSEILILEQTLASPEAEMVSVIGRRRVGKTFLVRSVFAGMIDFEMSGIQNATNSEQLRGFSNQLKAFLPKSLIGKPPSDWLDAFFLLIEYLKQKEKKERMVVFFDEVPWLAAHKSNFLKGLSYFWNSWASQENIVVVICGSSASWMIQKILRDKGGLHNRVTKRIRLKPFSLNETELYLHNRGVTYDRYHIMLIYMSMGGIPHYLKEVSPNLSAFQNINQICFSENGLLKDEFQSLYPALFDSADYHLAIIRALSGRHYGMLRKEIVQNIPFNDSGHITKVLYELVESGFISTFFPFDKKKKDKIFRLSDEYSLFYLRFIENHVQEEENIWLLLSQTQTYKTWCGYAFENICLQHIPQIKNALGISGIYSTATTYLKIGSTDQNGVQIDLTIDRNDHVINLVEVKFYNTVWNFTKSDAEKLREKQRIFQESTGTKKMISWVVISAFGIKHNAHSLGLVTKSLTFEDLFAE
jgi:uncharacterized protein